MRPTSDNSPGSDDSFLTAKFYFSLLVAILFVISIVVSLGASGWLLDFKLQEPLKGWASSIASSILASLLMSIVTYFIYSVRLGKIIEQKQHATIQKEMQIIAEKSLKISGSGIIGVHMSLNEADLTSLFSSARERIYVVENWICFDSEKIEESIKTALVNNDKLQVRIALLHPHSPTVIRRESDVEAPGIQHGDLSSMIERQLLKIVSWFHKWNVENVTGAAARCVLMCHDCVPSMQVYLSESRAFIGFYLQKTRSAAGIQIEVERGGSLYKAVEAHARCILEDRVDGNALKRIETRGPATGDTERLLKGELRRVLGRQMYGLIRQFSHFAPSDADRQKIRASFNGNEEAMKGAKSFSGIIRS